MLITSHNVRPYHFLYGWSDCTIFQLDLLLRCTNSLHSGLQSSAGCIVAETQPVS